MSVRIGRSNANKKKFSELEWGDVFFDCVDETWTHIGSALYMKTPLGVEPNGPGRWNAVCLNTGTVEIFEDGHTVDLASATILVNDAPPKDTDE